MKDLLKQAFQAGRNLGHAMGTGRPTYGLTFDEWYSENEKQALNIANPVKSLPTDDELDEAAVEYCKSVYSDRPEIDDYQDGVEAFDAGAVWMKERLT